MTTGYSQMPKKSFSESFECTIFDPRPHKRHLGYIQQKIDIRQKFRIPALILCHVHLDMLSKTGDSTFCIR